MGKMGTLGGLFDPFAHRCHMGKMALPEAHLTHMPICTPDCQKHKGLPSSFSPWLTISGCIWPSQEAICPSLGGPFAHHSQEAICPSLKTHLHFFGGLFAPWEGHLTHLHHLLRSAYGSNGPPGGPFVSICTPFSERKSAYGHMALPYYIGGGGPFVLALYGDFGGHFRKIALKIIKKH